MTPPLPAPVPQALARFISDCAENVNGWRRRGEALYPGMLTVEMAEAAIYRRGGSRRVGVGRAALAVAGAAVATVDVRCGLGARLSSPDGTIEIDEADRTLHEFEEPGVLQWKWTITATEPGEHELLTGSGSTTAFTTAVHVEASAIERVSIWWEENWDTIATAAADVGAAIVAVVAWLRTMSREVRGKAGEDEKEAEPRVGDDSGDDAASQPDRAGPA